MNTPMELFGFKVVTDATIPDGEIRVVGNGGEILGIITGISMKPPFDPLTAGWVACEADCHAYDREYNGTDGLGCPACDGLGIVVGPPEDGLEIAARWRHLPPELRRLALRLANTATRP